MSEIRSQTARAAAPGGVAAGGSRPGLALLVLAAAQLMVVLDGSVEVSIDPARFHDVFCADVPDADAAFMAISQRPVSATAFDDPATAAA
jgi:hypothetical protein